MSPLKRTLVVLIVGALPLAATVTAAAKKPPKDPSPAEPIGGYTCAESGYDQSSHGLVFSDTGFSLTLTGRSDGMCVDVMTGAAGVWKVTVTGHDVLSLLVVPRDSYSPGDSCGGVRVRSPELPLLQDLPDPSDPRHALGIPASTVNACGTTFGEWRDGMLVMDQTAEPHPLAFRIDMTGRPRAEATITVDLP